MSKITFFLTPSKKYKLTPSLVKKQTLLDLSDLPSRVSSLFVSHQEIAVVPCSH